ncbi:hypothetical protein T10_11437 [Trichinella papuae]|uniref:Uncharacterized protein n=1 Tax=Trichinella papuae TaxID=268474 RepID=A0A0V1MNB5_9BILA|nr:hypothetical protein T10_3321 [Trichinella papuae]KRZ74866.1 hypothetical protein T10_11437 [Trichinella papuae]
MTFICAFRWERECRISAKTYHFYSFATLMPHNLTNLPENCMGYHMTWTNLHVILNRECVPACKLARS